METFDPKILGGSIKRDIVNPDLIEERAKCSFDKLELAKFLYTEQTLNELKEIVEFIKSNPKLQTDIKYFEYDRIEKMTHWWELITIFYANPVMRQKHFIENSERGNIRYNWAYMLPGPSPIQLHQQMFTNSIKFLASEK